MSTKGVSSGLQNMIQGGDFGSGFMSGSVGHITGYAGGMIGGDVGGILGSGMGGGISSALSGGDLGRGFQTGAMQYMFNRMGEGLVNAGVEMVENGVKMVDGWLGSRNLSVGASADLSGVNASVVIGQGDAFQKSLQTPNVGGGVYVAWNPGGGKNLLTFGKWGVGAGIYLNDTGRWTGGCVMVGGSLLPVTGYRGI